MKNMNDRSNRNDKVMDIILEAAADKYAQDIAEKSIECDMTADEEKIMLEQEDRIYQNVMKQINKEEKSCRRPAFKKCAVLAASVAVIVCIAANVSAFRVFIFKTYTDMSGTFLNIKTEKIAKESYDVISEFERKDEIIIPDWLPPGAALKQITDDYTGINLEYQGDDLWLTIDEDLLPSNGSSVQIQTDKNEYTVGEIKVFDMDGVIVEIRNESGDHIFSAYWNSDNVKYELSTNGSKIMLDTILQNLKYLK
ncbi:MAG: DUF4367 domain-containing protein [bacterium]|nr:DUF4367 domain-containing protein [bacterium]